LSITPDAQGDPSGHEVGRKDRWCRAKGATTTPAWETGLASAAASVLGYGPSPAESDEDESEPSISMIVYKL